VLDVGWLLAYLLQSNSFLAQAQNPCSQFKEKFRRLSVTQWLEFQLHWRLAWESAYQPARNWRAVRRAWTGSRAFHGKIQNNHSDRGL